MESLCQEILREVRYNVARSVNYTAIDFEQSYWLNMVRYMGEKKYLLPAVARYLNIFSAELKLEIKIIAERWIVLYCI